jgi:hypothetical protein
MTEIIIDWGANWGSDSDDERSTTSSVIQHLCREEEHNGFKSAMEQGEFVEGVPTPEFPTTVQGALLLQHCSNRWAVEFLDNDNNGQYVSSLNCCLSPLTGSGSKDTRMMASYSKIWRSGQNQMYW